MLSYCTCSAWAIGTQRGANRACAALSPPSFSRHALGLSRGDLPRIPLSSVMADFLKRPRPEDEKFCTKMAS
ncbi:hypothetical protein VULLAG_LOCUS12245 [Vulpes lagopus]